MDMDSSARETRRFLTTLKGALAFQLEKVQFKTKFIQNK